jgi:hypothetical protein
MIQKSRAKQKTGAHIAGSSKSIRNDRDSGSISTTSEFSSRSQPVGESRSSIGGSRCLGFAGATTSSICSGATSGQSNGTTTNIFSIQGSSDKKNPPEIPCPPTLPKGPSSKSIQNAIARRRPRHNGHRFKVPNQFGEQLVSVSESRGPPARPTSAASDTSTPTSMATVEKLQADLNPSAQAQSWKRGHSR